jgi:hypothetical protein
VSNTPRNRKHMLALALKNADDAIALQREQGGGLTRAVP